MGISLCSWYVKCEGARGGVRSDVDSATVRRGEEGAEPKGEALDLTVDLRS